MDLTVRRKNDSEFYCELTDELDKIAGIEPKGDYCSWRHYINDDRYKAYDICLPIRLPGGTIDCVYISKDNIITEIFITSGGFINIYPKEINEILRKYIGAKLLNYNPTGR